MSSLAKKKREASWARNGYQKYGLKYQRQISARAAPQTIDASLPIYKKKKKKNLRVKGPPRREDIRLYTNDVVGLLNLVTVKDRVEKNSCLRRKFFTEKN